MIFRVGMPFTQIADCSFTHSPSRQSDGIVTKRHSLEQISKPFVPYRGDRRLLDEHMCSMNRTEQESASLAVGVTGLSMLTESIQCGLREMQ